MNIPGYYKDVSQRLVQVLDAVGLGEDIRWKRINTWLQIEELTSIVRDKKETVHVFGSHAEATTIIGLPLNVDMVFSCTSVTVVQDGESHLADNWTLRMIREENTAPGYVKLQVLHHPVHSVELDRYGCSVIHKNKILLNRRDMKEHHEPTNTANLGMLQFDKVYALRSFSWPQQAYQWITRRRRYNWPSKETVSIIQKAGVLLVPFGHQLSADRHLEWRLSVSFGEKLLLWQFNNTQYKCYVLLKMIRKHLINPMVGDNVLSSYHCKTCMFYMIESTPLSLWHPANVLFCIELCLRQLYSWVEESFCPNYFIPEENMFQYKVYGPVQAQLCSILRDLLRQEGRYLAGIPYENIGAKLVRACQSPLAMVGHQRKALYDMIRVIFCFFIDCFQLAWFELLKRGVQNNPSMLQRVHSPSKIREEVDVIVRKVCCSNLGSYLASQTLTKEDPDQESLDLACDLLLMASSSDVASGRLKLAAYHLTQERLIHMEDILRQIETNYTDFVVCLGGKLHEDVLDRIVDGTLSTTEILRQYVAFPIPYLPSEIYCTPKALIMEMFRSIGSELNILHPVKDYCLEWAVVDPKFYLHFLQYQCCYRQRKLLQRRLALNDMIRVICQEHLVIKETAINILAYCLKQEGNLNAYHVLCKSMKMKIQLNAAKWQIAFLINAKFGSLSNKENEMFRQLVMAKMAKKIP